MAAELWRIFESNIVVHSRMQRVPVIKVPEDVKWIAGRLIRKKTQFDFCASIDGVAVFFDAKSVTAENVFNFKSKLLADKKIHQWESLQMVHDRGTIAGILLYLAKQGLIGWASVPVIRTLIDSSLSIDKNSPGVIWQSDSDPINLRQLLAEDLKQWWAKQTLLKQTS